ncbi:LysR family transcriptional regulator [Rheinheimera sp.]|uniref:LysR family transcriptional regulator n=1 Tax=Rheinheimera sp. TaxID=1869214 RepID=UPI0027B89CF7|nr:LysR family transcriptional regulator [Rheinheimera sp.]
MNIKSKDLNLLLLFKVLFEELNVTAAAERMALSQPALSHKLNKLRHEFADPLFVRSARGLTATPKAIQLAPQVLALVSSLETFYQDSQSLDFLQQQSRFYLYTTDYIESLLLPKLLSRLMAQAPGVQLVTRNTMGLLPRQELERGECDLAIAGFYTDLPQTLYQKPLYQEDFVVLLRKQHPLSAAPLTLQAYCQAQHIVTTLTGDLDGIVDKELAKQGLKRHICAGISSFMAPPALVLHNDVLLTCLRSVAEAAVAQQPQLQIQPCPLPLNKVQISQIWHSRCQDDLLHQWLRKQIVDITSGC